MTHRLGLAVTACTLLSLLIPADALGEAVPHDAGRCANPAALQLPVEPRAAESHPAVNPCGGIRPGGALILRFGLEFTYCTMAFIVTDGTDLYVATAGHCVEPSLGVPGVGERVSALGVPGTFGTVAHQWCEGQALNGGCGPGTDFGLIRIDADKHGYVDPAMCHWGVASGGIFTENDETLRKAHHFGWGVVIGDPSGAVGVPLGNPATQARAAVGLDFTPPDFAVLEAAAISGDSGSGVLVSASLDADLLSPDPAPKALGVLTHIAAGGLAIVQRLDASLARAGADLGKTFTLVPA